MTEKPKTYADDLTLDEVAAEFEVDVVTVRRWMAHAQHPLGHRRVYGKLVIRRSDVRNRIKAVQEGRKQ